MEEGREGDGVSISEVSTNLPRTPLRRSKRLMELSNHIDGRDGVSSSEVSHLDNTELPHTPPRRSKRLVELSNHIDFPDRVSSMEVADLDYAKPSCRRSKRLVEFSKLNPNNQPLPKKPKFTPAEFTETNPNQPIAKKPMFTTMLFTCEICTETNPKTGIFHVKGCNHFYCSACIAKYIKSKVRNNILSITCPQPNCSSSIEPQQSQSILPKTLYDKWCFALCETLILETEGYYCPFERCSALVINELSKTCMKCECPHCERSFCVNCEVPWHQSLTCKEFEVRKNGSFDKLIKLAKRMKWQSCPKCKFYVTKSVGCNHMTCRCGCEFCYKCGKKYRLCRCRLGY